MLRARSSGGMAAGRGGARNPQGFAGGHRRWAMGAAAALRRAAAVANDDDDDPSSTSPAEPGDIEAPRRPRHERGAPSPESKHHRGAHKNEDGPIEAAHGAGRRAEGAERRQASAPMAMSAAGRPRGLGPAHPSGTKRWVGGRDKETEAKAVSTQLQVKRAEERAEPRGRQHDNSRPRAAERDGTLRRERLGYRKVSKDHL